MRGDYDGSKIKKKEIGQSIYSERGDAQAFSLKLIMQEVFERGEVVEVGGYENPEERIYLTKIEGCRMPYICVFPGDNDNFRAGRPFSTTLFKNIYKKGTRQKIASEPRRNRSADYTKRI